MNKTEIQETQEDKNNRQPYRVRLPGFLVEEEIGLGDVIKRVTSTFGIQPCDGCQRRAAVLNSWLVFSSGEHRR